MIELNTGYLDFEQLDAEFINIADGLLAFGIETVYVTYGFGCNAEKTIESEEIPVPIRKLVQFIVDSESDGVFELGEADLIIQAGNVEFRVCHECDIHCCGVMCPLLMSFRKRWATDYKTATNGTSVVAGVDYPAGRRIQASPNPIPAGI